MVTGGGSAVGNPILTSPDVRVVSFTGSTDRRPDREPDVRPHASRKSTSRWAARTSIMIMDDANLELAVDGCLWGGFGTTGQRCTAASRVVVHENVYRKFVDAFAARAKALVVGDGLSEDAEMGPSDQRCAAGDGDRST